MTNEKAIEILKTELACVNSFCDRKCANCDLALPLDDIIEAYQLAIKKLEQDGNAIRNIVKSYNQTAKEVYNIGHIDILDMR